MPVIAANVLVFTGVHWKARMCDFHYALEDTEDV